MPSLLNKLVERFYPSNNGHSVTFLGDRWSGKTSAVTAFGGEGNGYGNIGFWTSPVEAPTSNGTPLRFLAYDIGMGCGSARTMGLLYTSLVAMTDAVIWVIDSSERDQVQQSVNDLSAIVDAVEETRVKQGKQKRFPVLILANKQDLPNAVSIDDVRSALKAFASSHTCMVLPTCMKKSFAESGLQHGIDWLQIMLENPSLLAKATLVGQMGPPKYPKELTDKIEAWVNKLENDAGDEEFVKLFETFKLPAWDHYTHIRIAYLLLSTHGRQKGKDLIFEGLKSYITQSPPNTGRAFHFSMTYFWIQIVHLGIQNLSIRKVPESVAQAAPTLSSQEKDQFARFLLLNPYVADGSLWTNYYSVECLMGPSAKSSMVLPDKKPLPNLVVRDAV